MAVVARVVARVPADVGHEPVDLGAECAALGQRRVDHVARDRHHRHGLGDRVEAGDDHRVGRGRVPADARVDADEEHGHPRRQRTRRSATEVDRRNERVARAERRGDRRTRLVARERLVDEHLRFGGLGRARTSTRSPPGAGPPGRARRQADPVATRNRGNDRSTIDETTAATRQTRNRTSRTRIAPTTDGSMSDAASDSVFWVRNSPTRTSRAEHDGGQEERRQPSPAGDQVAETRDDRAQQPGPEAGQPAVPGVGASGIGGSPSPASKPAVASSPGSVGSAGTGAHSGRASPSSGGSGRPDPGRQGRLLADQGPAPS